MVVSDKAGEGEVKWKDEDEEDADEEEALARCEYDLLSGEWIGFRGTCKGLLVPESRRVGKGGKGEK